MIRVTEREVIEEMATLYRQAVSDTCTAIFEALGQCPESMSAREAGAAFKQAQPDMEGQMVAELDQKLAELGDLS